MAIPDYDTLILPLLKVLSDGKERAFGDCVDVLAKQFRLTADEQRELLPSRTPIFSSRAGWAKTYAKKAGLLEQPRRSWVKITERGTQVLKDPPEKIDIKFLRKFPEFVAFQSAHGSRDTSESARSEAAPSAVAKPPEEVIDSAFLSMKQQLASELLEQILRCSPTFFERLVVDLLVAMGYGGSVHDAGRALVVGKSGDGGIDGIIKQDKLGLDAIYVQAKRWEANISRPQIQGFVGALHGRANKGVFITTSSFTKEAREYADELRDLKVILIDGQDLADLMIEHGIGVSPKATYVVKKVDYDYFVEEE
ncbi:MAG TPA: restriction endonuclease [Planctomycetota bacterium]|jgi:restriction system protein